MSEVLALSDIKKAYTIQLRTILSLKDRKLTLDRVGDMADRNEDVAVFMIQVLELKQGLREFIDNYSSYSDDQKKLLYAAKEFMGRINEDLDAVKHISLLFQEVLRTARQQQVHRS